MSKSIVTRYEDFKAKHHLSDAMIIQMATNYANSDEACSMGYWADKYNVSRGVFNKARDFAIICCLVSPDVVKRIVSKSSGNYSEKNPKGTSDASKAHFAELTLLKKEFLNTFSVSEIQDIANKYIEGVSLSKIAIAYGTGEYGVQMLLKRGIIKLIISDEITAEIAKKATIDDMLARRAVNKKAMLECITNEIEVITFQIKNHSLYFAGITNPPTLNDLNNKLIILKNKRKMLGE